MRIASIDHIVLTVANLQRTLDFYVRVLGMREVDFANGRKALAFGSQKINLHVKGEEILPIRPKRKRRNGRYLLAYGYAA